MVYLGLVAQQGWLQLIPVSFVTYLWETRSVKFSPYPKGRNEHYQRRKETSNRKWMNILLMFSLFLNEWSVWKAVPGAISLKRIIKRIKIGKLLNFVNIPFQFESPTFCHDFFLHRKKQQLSTSIVIQWLQCLTGTLEIWIHILSHETHWVASCLLVISGSITGWIILRHRSLFWKRKWHHNTLEFSKSLWLLP